MRKFVTDASTVFNRAKQFTEEKLGTAEKTELDAHFENLLQRADKTKTFTEKILSQTECVLQPNPTLRMEELFYEKLDKKKRDRLNNHEFLGNYMVDAGNAFGPGTNYGNALIKAGQTQIQIGNSEREYIQSTANNFLQPLKNFLDGDMKTIMKEKKLLETKRLDLDACKSRLRKAKAQASKEQDELVAKAENDLRLAQSDFDRQAEITKLLLEGIGSTHAHHLRCLNDFIEAQMTYYAQCQQYMVDLQKQLGSESDTVEPGTYQDEPAASAPYYSVGSTLGGGSSIYVPNNNANPVRPSAPPAIQVTAPSPTEKKQARVLYDYDAAEASELSVLADELITVYSVQGMDAEWMMAERGNLRGKVPITYLEVLE